MPEDNHYVPIFYLKRWAGADGQVRVYSRPYRDAQVRRKHPAGIGYQTDLYTATDPDIAVATYLEREFFKVTDDFGSKALAVIEAGPWGSMHHQIRSGWTRFVMSLLHRNPEQIAKSHKTVSLYASIMRSKYEQEYEARKDDQHPPTFQEFWDEIRPAMIERMWIRLIQSNIDNFEVGNHVNKLVWRVIDFHGSDTLLTGDRPIIMTNGMVAPDSYLAIPIGPRKMFLATQNIEYSNFLAQGDSDQFISFINDRIVRQARRFCIGIDNSHLPIFTEQFGEMLPSSAIEVTPLPTADELRQMVFGDAKEVV